MASLKRPAESSSTDNALQKRSKVASHYPQVDTAEAAALRRSSFGSRSPGSPKQHTLQSAEVAADFKESLQDLHGNDRYQISNLTLIAKESTEHAMAIARVLETHIRTVGAFPDHYKRLHTTDTFDIDTSASKTTVSIRARLDREECWHAVHNLLCAELVQDLHGSIHTC